MSSTFQAQDGSAYERVMGRWSRTLAPLLVDFAGIADGEKILDVGCGTGSLTFTLPRKARLHSVVGIDYSEAYVEFARRHIGDARITIDHGDACALPYADGTFDRALAMLSLHFIPENERAVAEMRRVTRPGGVVAGAVWNLRGGGVSQRMFWDTAAAIDPAAIAVRGRHFGAPLTGPGEMAALWTKLGLREVEQTSLAVTFDHQSFEDYWHPFLSGEGSVGSYVASLSNAARSRLEEQLRLAYQAGGSDGPRSFLSAAWACRGVVAVL